MAAMTSHKNDLALPADLRTLSSSGGFRKHNVLRERMGKGAVCEATCSVVTFQGGYTQAYCFAYHWVNGDIPLEAILTIYTHCFIVAVRNL